MAFIQSNQNEEDEDQQLQPGQSSGGDGVLTPSAGASSPTNSPSKPQGFATLQSYLKVNKPQGEQLASQVASDTAKVGDEARASIQSAADTIGGKVSQNTYKPDVINEAISNPSAFAKDPMKLQEFKTQKNAQYQGPNSFEENAEAQNAAAQVQNAQQKSQLLDTESGRKTLLDDVQKNKAAGITALNQSLLSTNPNAAATLQGAKASFAGLQDMLGAKGTEINTNIANSKQAADAARADATSKIDAKIAEFGQGLQTRTTDVRAQLDALSQSATAKLANGQPLTNDELKALNTTQEIMGEIRKQQDILKRFYGTNFDIPSYATQQPGGMAITPENLATTADYDTENALEMLSESNLPYLNEANRSKAGTAPKSLVDFKGNEAHTTSKQLVTEKDSSSLDQVLQSNQDLANKIDNHSPHAGAYAPKFASSLNAAAADPGRLTFELDRAGGSAGALATAKLILASDRQGRFKFGESKWPNGTGLTPTTRAALEAMVK